jgi:hypothetical protein
MRQTASHVSCGRIAAGRPGILCLGFVCLAAHASAATVTQTFTTQQSAADAGWTAFNTTINGNNYGWSNTNLVTGTGGEAGGIIARGTNNYYADTTLGNLGTEAGSLSRATDSLFMSGKLRLADNNFNGAFAVGFFDRNSTSYGTFMGIGFGEPSTPGGPFRGNVSVGPTGGTLTPSVPVSVNQSTVYEFSLTWTPSGGLGGGTLSGQFGGSPFSTTVSAATATYDAFGIFSRSNSVDSGQQTAPSYFDDLTYTVAVPEPTILPLLIAGSLPLAWWQARRRVRVDPR